LSLLKKGINTLDYDRANMSIKQVTIISFKFAWKTCKIGAYTWRRYGSKSQKTFNFPRSAFSFVSKITHKWPFNGAILMIFKGEY